MCSLPLRAYDVRQESEMLQPLDFNRRLRLKHVAKVFKAEISNVIRLTEMEKLFHIRILDAADRERFAFLPGQFVMIEVPGYGEALAADTGSAVIGNIIDLGFADYEVPDWYTRWVTVYILD